MHKTDLVAAAAYQANLPKEKAAGVVNAILDEITNAVSCNETVSLVGFGSFSQRHRAAPTGRSPKIGASNTVGFKAGKVLKDRVNS